jgi:Ca2+-binding RTX toxin-like protein
MSQTTLTHTQTLVIFDSQVADLPLLYNALLPGSIAHTIQPHQDSIDLITNLLTQTGATKLAIVAHGQPGAIQMGNGKIDRAMLETRSGLFQEWGLDSIALYSCEVGMDAEFIQRFGELTGAKIVAATSKVGTGNWELDGGERMLEIDRLAAYQHTLTTFTGTAGNDTADVTTAVFGVPYLIGFTGGTTIDLTDGIGDIFNGGNGQDYIIAGNGDDRINSNYLKGTNNGGVGNDFLYINSFVNVPNQITFTGANAGTLSTNGIQTGTFYGIEQLAFIGFNGDDTVFANSANLSVTSQGTGFAALDLDGLGGNDYLSGSAGDDKINGGTGNDTIFGNAGSNILNGGDGDDYISADYMRDIVDGGIGNDFLSISTPSSTDAYTVEFTGANSGTFKINGTQTGTFTGIEQLLFYGNNGNDVIDASLANLSVTPVGTFLGVTSGLSIRGSGGSDTVLGSVGKDEIYGGDDNDYLLGQGGDDTIYGQAGFDIIFGGSGIDTISGGGLNDTIFGGIGNDIITGDDGEDYLYGEDDNDTIKGGYGFDVIYGQAGDDIIYGEGVTVDAGGNDLTVAPAPGVGINDTIFGGIGNDTIYGGIGDDYLLGEDGNDYLYGGVGTDFIYGGIGGDALIGEAGNDYLVGQDGDDGLYSGDGIDYLEGGTGNDILYGGNNDDFLYGNIGIDNLNGDAGDDFLDGGDGDDILRGNDGNDVLFGVEGDDYLNGIEGNDYLYGGNGNDRLIGYTGSDFLIGGAGSDTFEYYFMTDAGDTITDFNSETGGDKLNLSYLFNTSLGIASSSVNTNYLKFTQSGANALCQIDQDGTGAAYGFVTMATLNNVTASQLSFTVGGNVIV